MSNLIPVKRLDRNGHLVTRHVRPDSLTGGKQKEIAPPTLSNPAPKAEPQSQHVAYNNDPRVMNGEVMDRVIVEEVLYSRMREGVSAADFSSIRVQLNRPLRDGESDKIASLVGYAFKVNLRTQWGSVEVEATDTPYSVILGADTDTAGTLDLEIALERFQDQLPEMFSEGSPVRKTDRAGSGTKGTRAVQGFNDDDLQFEFYFDKVNGDIGAKVAQERGVDIEAIDAVLSHDVKPLSEGVL